MSIRKSGTLCLIAGLFIAGSAHAAKFADFDGDGKSDIFWRHLGTGDTYIYPMNGTAILAGEGYARTVADASWQVVGIADFNGDGRADILWRNVSTGDNYIYLMNGTTISGEGYLRAVADQNWQVVGVGDFNKDGKDDILWRNQATGDNYIYLMNGTTIVGEGYIRTVADQNWQVAGVGDFDGDGKADILWRNISTGQNYIYPMDGLAIKGTEGYLRTVADQNWQIAGVGDFNGDLSADILWRNSSTGENYIYLMNGTTINGEGYIRTVADKNWRIAAVGDYNGDGAYDILWHNVSTGDNYIYFLSGASIAGEGYTRTVADTRWHPIGESTPVSLAQVEVQQTLSTTKSIINAKDVALDYTDLQPFYDTANCLNDGYDWTFDSALFADGYRGVTVLSLVRAKLVAYNAANRIISVTVGELDNVSATFQVTGEDDPFRFKRQADGSWRFSGNRRPGATHVQNWMRTDQLPGLTAGTEMKTEPRQQVSVDFRPPVNSIASVTISGGLFSATPLAKNSFNGQVVTETLSVQASPPPAMPVTYQRDIWFIDMDGSASQGTVFTFTATPATGPQNVFTTITQNPATTDMAFALVQPDATKHALVNANLGNPLNVSWTNPTQFTVAKTKLLGNVSTTNFQCPVSGHKTPGATSGSITFPATCSGEAAISATVNLIVQGVNGERAIIIYTFSG